MVIGYLLFYFVLHSAFCVLQTQQDTISFRLWSMKMCERLLLGVCVSRYLKYITPAPAQGHQNGEQCETLRLWDCRIHTACKLV